MEQVDEFELAREDKREAVDLTGRRLTELPAVIEQIPSLRSLCLAHNELTTLPPSLSAFPNLREIDLTGNRIERLPPSILQLSQLTTLRLTGNPLWELPSGLSRLRELRTIDLIATGIVNLPLELFELPHLERLTLAGCTRGSNYISRIANLRRLTYLDMRATGLLSLPQEVDRLDRLVVLLLDDNRLVSLPSCLSKLRSLRTLSVANNPLPIPPELAQQITEPKVILSELLSQKRRPINEAKLILVGEANVGKSSIARRLTGRSPVDKSETTQGIDILRWRIHSGAGSTIRVNIWDFGGQEILHSTHQFFLTKRALYVLVLNARDSAEQNRVEYWLRMIDSFGGGSPIVIVGNHCDEHPFLIDRRGLQRRYPMVQAFIETSCVTGEGLEDFIDLLNDQILGLPHIHDSLSPSWFSVKREMEGLQADYIPVHVYEAICERHGVIDEVSRHALLAVLHDLGVVVNYSDDPRLNDTNILNPEWVTRGVYSVLHSRTAIAQKGILSRADIAAIFGNDTRYPPEKQLFIVDMMQRFELCVVMDQQGDRFLIPDLLSPEEPYTGDWTDALRFEYSYDVLPQSIISRFIARAFGNIPAQACWRSGAVVTSRSAQAHVHAEWEDRRVIIEVNGQTAVGRRELLASVRSQFDGIHRSIANLGVAEFAVLRSPSGATSTISYPYLLDLEELGEPAIIPPGWRAPASVDAILDDFEEFRSRKDRELARRERSLGLDTRPPPATPEVDRGSRPLGTRQIVKYLAMFGVVGALIVLLSIFTSVAAVVVLIPLVVVVAGFIVVSALTERGDMSPAEFVASLSVLLRRRSDKPDGGG